MAKIFMSMSGEGRGHATRVAALVEALRGRHELMLFAPGDAFEMLSPMYAAQGIPVWNIPGILNRYDESGRFHLMGTGVRALSYLWKLPKLIARLEQCIRAEKPDLIISDFEPALPRAADRAKVPHMVINHQHIMVVSDLSGLPGWLRRKVFSMGLLVKLYHQRQVATVVSSFFTPPLKPAYHDVQQIGVLLRPNVLGAQPTAGEHLVAYLRRSAPRQLLHALQETRRDVHVYGLGAHGKLGRLRLHAIDPERFVSDLASARALVTTAGNQIVGEALYLGKPVLGLPEAKNFEQYLNAHLLRDSGCGMAVPIESCDASHVRRFLDEFPSLPDVPRPSFDGTAAAANAVENQLARLRERRPPQLQQVA